MREAPRPRRPPSLTGPDSGNWTNPFLGAAGLRQTRRETPSHCLKKNGPRSRGPFPSSVLLVVPVMVTPDDHLTVAVAMIPSTMPAVVMPINLNTGAVIIAVAIVVPVAADAEAEPFSACDCRRRNRKGRQRGENVSKLLHVPSPIRSE